MQSSNFKYLTQIDNGIKKFGKNQKSKQLIVDSFVGSWIQKLHVAGEKILYLLLFSGRDMQKMKRVKSKSTQGCM